MKHSTSLTSLSSMDKDLYLSSLTQYGRAALKEQSYTASPSNSYMTEEPHFHRKSSLQLQRLGEAVPSIPHKRQKRHSMITANLCGTRYEVVRHTVEKLGFTVVTDDDPTSYLIWNDSFVSPDRISELKQYQHVNHFPGMGEVTRKDALARNFSKMQKAMPDVYNFVPKTWVLPSDYTVLQNYAKDKKQKKKNVTFIVKPSNGAQGHGISLHKNTEKIPSSEHFIVQEYIDKPLLLDGYKFDLRIYVLITSCDPLRIFLYSDGLVRLATEKYMPPHENNLNRLFMHLTNYSVNKHNEFYDKNMAFDNGSKRSIRYFNEYLRRSDIDVGMLWRRIADMIVQTLLVAQPHVLHAYRMCRPGVPFGGNSVCFEILGFDVMIDRKLRPWLLEINRSPSFGTDERLDYEIKSALLEDTFRLLNIRVGDKRKNIQAQKAEAQRRLFKTNRKVDASEITELDKRKATNEKRKEELKELLSRVRKIAAKEDFERRNCGRFRKIFPSENNEKQEQYCKIMSEAFSVFLAGRGASMQREIQVNYGNKYKEEEILYLIAECEADERASRLYSGRKPQIGPKPLQSMPESLPPPSHDENIEDDSNDSLSTTPRSRQRSVSSGSRSRSYSQQRQCSDGSRPACSAKVISSALLGQRPVSQPSSGGSQHRSRSLARAVITNRLTVLQRSNVNNFQNGLLMGKDDELTKKTLASLIEMKIKFPGKSDEEADLLLDEINQNWKFHKPRIASYWLVKLDSIKQRKVIDIVKYNVRAMLQHIWHTTDIDNLRLCRIFGRVFNRLLWSHGQGLWLCFSSRGGNVWETIFSKSAERISDIELDCCRRITQLCQDCLLIVYKFADEAKSSVSNSSNEQEQQKMENKNHIHPKNGHVTNTDMKPPKNWTLQTKHSQRLSKFYQFSDHSSS